MIGDLYNDVFNMSLSIVPSALGELGMPAVDEATLTAVAGDVSTWFAANKGSGGVGFTRGAQLTSIKLNRIDTAGHYADPVAMEHIYPSPIVGPLAGDFPPQLSIVATLGTALERGRGSKGRIYLAPSAGIFVGTDGRNNVTFTQETATGVKALIDSLNARYTAIGRVGVASKAGSGRFEHVTRVSVGRINDTMRSRRSKGVEDYQEVTI